MILDICFFMIDILHIWNNFLFYCFQYSSNNFCGWVDSDQKYMHQVYMILFDDWNYWFSPVILLTWHHCYKGPISKTWGRPCSQEGSSCRFGKWGLFRIDQWNPVKAKRCMCWDGFRTRKGIASMSLVSCFCLIWEVMNDLNSLLFFWWLAEQEACCRKC